MIKSTFLKEQLFNKASLSKECYFCRYWYFLDKGFNFQPNDGNSCHDALMMPVNLNDIAILNNNGADYRCIINGFSKSDTVDLL